MVDKLLQIVLNSCTIQHFLKISQMRSQPRVKALIAYRRKQVNSTPGTLALPASAGPCERGCKRSMRSPRGSAEAVQGTCRYP